MKRTKENDLFLGFGLWFILITFVGFGPTFYLRTEPIELQPHLIIHGLVFSLWILLFMVQTSLVYSKNIKLHMTLGTAGLILIVAMIPIGAYPVLYKVSIGTKTVTHAGHNLFGLWAGFIFFFLGYYKRKKAFQHKRFMLFATIMFTTAAIDRVAFILQLDGSLLFRKGLTLLPAMVILFVDSYSRKKLVGFDLIPAVVLMGIYYFASSFWLSDFGAYAMGKLVRLV